MVCDREFESPSISLVRINDGPSDSTATKASITKNLSATDQQVVNSCLLHPELMAQPYHPNGDFISTAFWGDVSRSAPVDDGEVVAPSSVAASSAGGANAATTSAVARVVLKATSVTAVPRTEVAEVGAPAAAVSPRSEQPRRIVIKVPTTAVNVKKAANSLASSSVVRIPVSTGIKRPLEITDHNTPKLARISQLSTNSSIANKTKLELENVQLQKQNIELRERNNELQEKLSLLNRLLMNPRKLDLLHARLQQFHKSAC